MFLQLNDKLIINTDKICYIRYSERPIFDDEGKNRYYLLNIYTTHQTVATIYFSSIEERYEMVKKLKNWLSCADI